MDVSTAYGEDIARIKELLVSSTKEVSKVAQDKEIKALMIGFEQYSLGFRLQCWIGNPEDKGSAKGALMEAIYLNFYEEGIEIAMTREQNITMNHEQLPPQEIRITQFPETTNSVYVKEFPDTKQEIKVESFPDTKQEMHIKEVPNLFGTGNMKKMTKVSKVPTKTSIPTFMEKSLNKEKKDNEK